MVFSRSSLIAIAITSAAISATEGTVVGRSPFGVENSTTTHTEAQSILAPRSSSIFSLCGVDLVGGDIWQAQHKEPDLCVSNCLAETGCDAATWTNFNGGTCFFKRLQGSWASSVPKVGAISFMRVDSGSEYKGPEFPRDVDMPGNDGENFRGPTLDDCFRRLRLSDYTGFTWTSYQGGTCWMKTRASPYVYSPGAISHYARKTFYPNKCL
jgi:hypothetical protein